MMINHTKWILWSYNEFEKNNNKQSLKIDSCTQKKTWYVKCNKTITALHFVQYNVLWSTEKQYWLLDPLISHDAVPEVPVAV
jgi:hypothetical protein